MDEIDVRALAAAQREWVIEMRRALHRIPELGFEEYKTQALIAAKLAELGIPYTTERTWVVGLIEGALPGKVVALRADIDALPIDETGDLPFRSEHPGRMHACGHDAHTAIQLGAARLLTGLRAHLRGSVKLLFQPAEETVGGALPMARAGVLEAPAVSAVYGLHVMPRLTTGSVETRAGALNAACDDVEIVVHGKGGHGAYPESGVDAIVCAAQVLSSLQTLVSRNVSPLESAVLSFGVVEGGRAANVICDRVRLRGTLRTCAGALRALMARRIRETATGVAEAFGARAEVTIKAGYCPLINDPDKAALVLAAAASLYGHENALVKGAPSMGGEDFGYLTERVPGAFYHIGCALPGEGDAQPLHSANFFLDEDCLEIGVAMQSELVLRELSDAAPRGDHP